jgi:cytochrome c55X
MAPFFLIQINFRQALLAHPTAMPRNVVAGCLIAAVWSAASAAADPVAPARQSELVRMVRQDCGSCHGLTLKGGLGPPLVTAALKDRPAESLKYAILQGRPGTPMPPWRNLLTEAEAEWIVARLLQGFPDER